MHYRRFAPLFNLQPLGARAGLPAHDLVDLGDNRYRLTLVATGLRREDIEVETHLNRLRVHGKPADEARAESDTPRFVHRGLGVPMLDATFDLGQHVEVADARLENGLLHIDLKRELPEALQPRTIAVNSAVEDGTVLTGSAVTIEGESATTGDSASGNNEKLAAA